MEKLIIKFRGVGYAKDASLKTVLGKTLKFYKFKKQPNVHLTVADKRKNDEFKNTLKY